MTHILGGGGGGEGGGGKVHVTCVIMTHCVQKSISNSLLPKILLSNLINVTALGLNVLYNGI